MTVQWQGCECSADLLISVFLMLFSKKKKSSDINASSRNFVFFSRVVGGAGHFQFVFFFVFFFL